ncbi:MAG: hypothetical protein GY756_06750 [bacterium]|nr:hypothetical protein [bacterium]
MKLDCYTTENKFPQLHGYFYDEYIQKAFEQVCHRRRNHCCNNDIWELKFNWNSRKHEILEELNSENYKFDSVKEFRKDGQVYEIWTAKDAVVIEKLTILLKDKYKITENCSSYHLKGKGGVKAAINKIRKNYRNYKFVMITDVKKYYASINHDCLFEILRKHITETRVLCLLYQFMKRTVCRDGYYKTFEKGICRGTSLSPIIGALYLEVLDMEMEKKSLFYMY